jgi:hypothetical protein
MNWDAIGAVAELLAAFGVIASLIYLAVQIRQNTESVRMASHHGVTDQVQRSNLAFVQDAEIAELLARGLPDTSSLSDVDRIRFEGILLAIFRTYEELYQLHRKGLTDDELWDSREQSMMRWLSYPGVRSWWCGERSVMVFTASFSAHVEGRLSEAAAQKRHEADVEQLVQISAVPSGINLLRLGALGGLFADELPRMLTSDRRRARTSRVTRAR